MSPTKKEKKKKYKYVVVRSWKGGQKSMFTTYDYRQALKYYLEHPQAYGIQRYSGGWTAGLLQPDMPSKIKVKGKTYERPYVGPHSKQTAQALAEDFRKDKKHFKDVIIRKFKRGYQLYAR